MRISLGIATLTRYDLCAKMIESACDGVTRKPDHVVVIDNGGNLPASGLHSLKHEVEVLRPGKNLGVGPSWNVLARHCLQSPDDRLLISGDDVELNSDVIDTLVKTMEECGLDFVFPDSNRSINHTMFSCFMVRSTLFEKVGYFDEKFWPAYFEDNDFQRRMNFVEATYGVSPCGYRHASSATMKSYTPDELEAHHVRFRACRDYYVSKWGGLPGAEKFTMPFDGHGEGSLSF